MTPDPPSTDGTETWQPAADGSSGTTAAVSVQEKAAQIVGERPEVAVGAAFAGGVVLALILKRLAR